MSDVPETKTDLCNGALALLGGGIAQDAWLTSYENDTGNTADWCRKLLDKAIEKAVVRHDWNLAEKYLLATASGANTDDQTGIEHTGYDYAYLPPSDCLALCGIVDEDKATLEYAYVNGYVHTDYETDDFTWHYLQIPANGFPPGLRDCIEYELAILLASPLFGGEKGMQLRQGLMREYLQTVLPEARAQNQREQYDEINENAPDLWSEIT